LEDSRRQPAYIAPAVASAKPGSAFNDLLRNAEHPSLLVNLPLAQSREAILTKRDINEADDQDHEVSTDEGTPVAPEETGSTATISQEVPTEIQPVIDRKLIDRRRHQSQNMQPLAGESDRPSWWPGPSKATRNRNPLVPLV